MNRRRFLKGILGVAGAAALPAATFDAIAKVVAMPGEKATHIFSVFVRATVATTVNANGVVVNVGPGTDGNHYPSGWQRITVPLRFERPEELRVTLGGAASFLYAQLETLPESFTYQ